MAKKVLSVLLTLLIVFSSINMTVFASTGWTYSVSPANVGNTDWQMYNCSSYYFDWDSETGLYYKHYVSVEAKDGRKLRIGRWGMDNRIGEYGKKFYVGIYARTNSASIPKYTPMNTYNEAGTKVEGSFTTAGQTAFVANGEWEFNYIEFDLSSTDIHSFGHGQLDFDTGDGCYIDVASWGIFAPTVSKEDAKATLISSTKMTESQVYTVICKDRDDSIVKTFNVSTKLPGSDKKIVLPTLNDTATERFMGWAETKDATTATLLGGAEYTPGADVVLYPVYTTVPLHNVTYKVDGEKFAEFSVKEDSDLIFPTTYPEKEGKYFTGWDNDITVMGKEDIVLNATFVDKTEAGVHYYWNGEAKTEGDGSINRPFKMFKKLIEATNATGGVVIVAGKSLADQYHVKATNKDDITFTSVDPLTGHDYRGTFSSDKNTYSGASFYVTSGSIYWGGATYQTGKITFKDIDILNVAGQYGQASFNFDGHPFEIGENVNNYVSDYGTELNWKLSDMFIGAAGPNNVANIKTAKGIFRTKQTGANWLARGGAVTLDSVDYEFYAKTFVNFCQNGADAATVNGPIRFTYYAGSKDSKLHHPNAAYAFGSKAYASIILNDDVTITNQLDVSESGLNNKVYIIKSSSQGVVTHTDIKGKYKIDSETMNYAQILDSEDQVVAEGIIDGNLRLSVPEYGEYHIAYSQRDVYCAEYITTPYDDVAPIKYSVTSDETDKHTITLPTIARQNAHKFLGWTTTNGSTEVEYAGGAQYTLSGNVKFYAVWEDIRSTSITFKDDEGEVIAVVEGYVGSHITFPTKNMYKYGQKFLGYAYEGTTDILDENSTMPEEPMVAVPVWGEIPANETKIYVNADTGKSTNSGISPDAALDTIAAATERLKTSGGYIIVTGGTNVLNEGWNNSGDITLTSLDPVTKINYKATELSADGLSFTGGAVISYKGTRLGGTTVTTGKITLNNLAMLNNAGWTYISFEAHPFELGEGLSIYQKTASGKAITKDMLYVRAMGETNSINTNPDGIKFTLNTIDGNARVFTIGKAATVVPNMEITINSAFQSELKFGNDSGGGISSVKGDVKFILNASITKKTSFSEYTNPVEGDVYVLCNNYSSGDLSGIKQANGYGQYKVTVGETGVLSYGDTKGELVITRKDGNNYKFAKVVDADGKILDYIDVSSGSGKFTLKDYGNYEVEFADESYHKISFVTGDDNIVLPEIWGQDGTDVEIEKELYRYGYTFEGWTDGATTYTDGVIVMPTENVTLTAIWSIAPKYTITFDANGSDINVPEAVTEYVNENVVLDKVSSSNASFIGWSEDKNAKTGALNHKITKDTTLYAITTTEPTYIIDTHFRGQPYDNASRTSSSRRYIIDVYLENAKASSGKFKLSLNSKAIYYLGHIPIDGITATVKTTGSSGYVDGFPGLQTRTTSAIEFTWESANEIDAQNGRRKIARLMLPLSYWGAGYQNLEVVTTDEVVAPFDGYATTIDNSEAFICAKFFDVIKSVQTTATVKI